MPGLLVDANDLLQEGEDLPPTMQVIPTLALYGVLRGDAPITVGDRTASVSQLELWRHLRRINARDIAPQCDAGPQSPRRGTARSNRWHNDISGDFFVGNKGDVRIGWCEQRERPQMGMIRKGTDGLSATSAFNDRRLA